MTISRKALILIYVLSFVFSQRVFPQTVFVSPTAFDDGNFDNIKVIGQDDDGIFLLESNLSFESDRDRVGFKSRKFKVAYFNHQLQPKWIKEIEPMPADASVQAITFSQEKILIISTVFNRAQNKVSLFSQWMNDKGEITANKETGIITLEKNSDYDKVRLIASGNRQLTGILMQEYIDDQKQSVHLFVMDSAFKVVNNKNLLINYGTKKFAASDFSLSDKGDFHLLGVRTTKDKSAGKKKQETYILFSAPADSTNLSEFLISENGNDATNASINFDNINNKIVCAGFFDDRTAPTGAGIIFAAIEMKSPLQMVYKTHSIENGGQFKLLGERNRDADIGLSNYQIEKIILRKDGGAVLVAEASYTTDYSYYDYFTQSYTSRTEYHFNNIVIIAVNLNGNIDWLNVVRKNQESEDDGGVFSSFCPVLTSDELILIYNSDISRNSEVLGARTSKTGAQTENHLVRPSEHLLLYSRSGKQVSEDEVVIPCISKKKLSLVKITF
jgi:hypothetical protein